MANTSIQVTEAFDFAPDGIQIVRITTGRKTVGKRCRGDEVTERCAEVALESGWAKKARGSSKTEEPEGGAEDGAEQDGSEGGEGDGSEQEGSEKS